MHSQVRQILDSSSDSNDSDISDSGHSFRKSMAMCSISRGKFLHHAPQMKRF